MTEQGMIYNSNYKPWLQATNVAASTNWGLANAGAANTGMYSGWGNIGMSGGIVGNVTTPTVSASESSSDSKSSEEQKKAREALKQEIIEKKRKKIASTIFTGLTKKEEEVLLQEHAKTFEPMGTLGSSLGFGVGLTAVMKNGGIVSHGINTVKTAMPGSVTNTMFRGNKELHKKYGNLMQEAYYQMHKAERRHQKGLGMIKKSAN